MAILNGDSGNNVLSTGNGDDTLSGNGGNDTLSSGNDNDSLNGGSGNDDLSSGNDNDTLDGGSGDDVINGGNGNDLILGSEGSDTIDGGNNTDTYTGIAGADTFSFLRIERVNTGNGNDRLLATNASVFTTVVDLGSGDDAMSFSGTASFATINGGQGNDTVAGSAGADLWSFSEVEQLSADAGNDVITTTGSLESASLGDGDDALTFSDAADATVNGGTGSDTVTGSSSADELSVAEVEQVTLGNGNDRVTFTSAASGTTVNGGSNNDTVSGSSNGDDLTTIDVERVDLNDGNDFLRVSGAGGASVSGGNGNDTIEGGSGNDTIAGGTGSDLIASGGGSDAIDGGADSDTVNGSANGDSLTLTGVEQLSANGGNDTVTADAALGSVSLGSGNDQLTFTAATTATIDGGANSDSVTGSSGNDRLTVTATERLDAGNGNDSLTVTDGTAISINLGNGVDTLVFQAAANATVADGGGLDTVIGSASNDVIQSGGGLIERFELGDGNDTLTELGNAVTVITVLGGAGDDALSISSDASVSGGAGNDLIAFNPTGAGEIATVNGGTGSDTVNGSSGADTLTVSEVEQVSLGNGNDQVTLLSALPPLTPINGGSGNDTLVGSSGNDDITAFDFERIDLSDGNDFLRVSSTGGASVSGGNGNDTILSGSGGDTLNGGAGNDHFTYTATAQSTASNQDRIQGFVQGSDLISIPSIDGTADLLFNGTTSHASRVWYEQTGGNTFVHYGTGAGHFQFRLDGAYTLTVNDFIGLTQANTAPTTGLVGGTFSEDFNGGILVTTLPPGSVNDADGDPLTHTLVSSPRPAATLSPSGIFTLPLDQDLDTGESRTLTFTYKVNDGTVDSNISEIRITINGANDAPVAVNGTASGSEDDASITGSVTATDVDVEPLTYSLVGGPVAGLTFNSNGTYSYVPQAADQALDTGETRQVTFSYKANDGTVDSNTANVTITVNGANDAPVAQNGTASGSEDAVSIAGSVTATDVDIEPLTYSLVGGPVAGLTFNSDGSYSYVPQAADQALDTGESRNVTFQYKANDGTVDSNTANVTITVNGANDAPVAQNGTASGSEDAASIAGSVTATDVDIEPLTYSLVGGPVAGLTFNSDGSYSYVPQAADQALDTGESRNVTFQYKANDGTVDSNTANVTITVNGANDAPVAVNVGALAGEDVASIGGNLAATDVDMEPLTYSLVGGPVAGLTVNADGTYSYVPQAVDQALDTGESRQFTFQYKANDGTVDSNTADATIIIRGANDAPVAQNGTASGSEDAASITGSVTATDVDIEPLTYALVGGPVAGLTFNSDGTYSYVPAAAFQSLAAGDSGTVNFQFTANDGTVDSSAANVTITVNGANDAPVIAETAALTIDEDTTGTGLAGASDVDANDTLSYTKTNGTHGTVTVGADGQWSYVPEANYHGTDSFTITVSDGLLSDTQTVSVTINSVPDVTDIVWNGIDVGGVLPTVAGDAVATLDGAPAGFGYRIVGGTAPVATTVGGSVTATGAFAPGGSYTVDVEAYVLATGVTEYAETFTVQTSTSAPDSVTLTGKDDVVYFAQDGNDSVLGGAGDDALLGQNGDDTLNGGLGNDQLVGGTGNDHFNFGLDAGQDRIVEAGGYSEYDRTVLLAEGTELETLGFRYDGTVATLSFNGNSVTMDQAAAGGGVEHVQFNNGTFLGLELMAQTYFLVTNGVGTAGRDVLGGTAGNDTLDGDYSTDLLFGNEGNDSLVGGWGDDILIGGAGNDTIDAGGFVDSDIIAYLSVDSGTDVIKNFDADPSGSIQDKIDLDRLFDELGVFDADRAHGIGFLIIGNDLFVNLDGDTTTGGSGASTGFEYHLATVHATFGVFDALDVVTGTQ